MYLIHSYITGENVARLWGKPFFTLRLFIYVNTRETQIGVIAGENTKTSNCSCNLLDLLGLYCRILNILYRRYIEVNYTAMLLTVISCSDGES